MSSLHLAKLNAEQRHAVEYGGLTYADAGPLLIIAGAGSGKTNTLAHRVAHLIAALLASYRLGTTNWLSRDTPRRDEPNRIDHSGAQTDAWTGARRILRLVEP